MALWKRLTGVNGEQVDVNMDQVCYMLRQPHETTIHFVSDAAYMVKEKADDIHMAKPLRSMRA
jgi:uncharacterized protein YlzI (FlbEa/FlbD family)